MTIPLCGVCVLINLLIAVNRAQAMDEHFSVKCSAIYGMEALPSGSVWP